MNKLAVSEHPNKTKKFMNRIVAKTIKAIVFIVLGYVWALHINL